MLHTEPEGIRVENPFRIPLVLMNTGAANGRSEIERERERYGRTGGRTDIQTDTQTDGQYCCNMDVEHIRKDGNTAIAV